MKVKGIPVGTPMLRPDWNQDNPLKADYIKNKPDLDALKGIYLGPGEMPDGYNVQIDPNGDALNLDELYAHIEDTQNPHNVTAEQIGVAPATESTEHPGCYYRIVGGEIEWINPPMLSGVEYRTTERYSGGAVYTKLIELDITANGQTIVKWHESTAGAIRHTARIFSQTLPLRDSNGNCLCDVQLVANEAYITCSSSWAVNKAIQLQAFYIK